MTIKVVFDTSCLISAAIRPDSIPDEAVKLALATCQICTNVDALEELSEVLQRTRFNSYVSLDSRMAFFKALCLDSQLFTLNESVLREVKGICRDPNDDFILALALFAQVDVIVSSDHDLLTLHPWNGIPILSPAQFLSQFSS